MEGSLEEEGYTNTLVVPFGVSTVEIGGGDGADSQNTYSVLSALPMDLDPVASDDFDVGGCVDSGEFSPDEFEGEYVFRHDGPCGYGSDGCPSDVGH